MSLNLIAILVSLAMMLTGAGGEGQPAEATRNLVLSNVSMTYNGRSLQLGPQARVGVSTDGQKALYDFALELEGQKLFPMQLSAGEAGITARDLNGGAAVTVTAEALAELARQMEDQVNASLTAPDGDATQLMQFLTEEYLPAYMAMLQTAMDEEMTREMQAAGEAIFDEMVDRGTGTPANIEVDGEPYDVISYSYSLDTAQMAQLADAVYTSIPVLNDYYNAMFRLYGMMPEESGLRGIDSFTAMFEKLGMQMRMDIEEQRSFDGAVDVMDCVMTMDLNAMMSAQGAVVEPAPTDAPAAPEAEEAEQAEAAEAEAAPTDVPLLPEVGEGGDEAAEVPAVEPFVMNIHTVTMGEYRESEASCTFDAGENQTCDFNMVVTCAGDAREFEGTMTLNEDGQKQTGGRVSGFIPRDEEGGANYSLNVRAIQKDAFDYSAGFYGTCTADGLAANTASFEVVTPDDSFSLSFDLMVTDDAIEDVTSGGEVDCVIDDLSEEGIQALGQNPAMIGATMKLLGSLSQDVAKLTEDPGVNTLLSVIGGEGLPISVDGLDEEDAGYSFDFQAEPEGDADYTYVIDGDDDAYLDFGGEDVEDDGVLAFAVPRLTWLPEGWTVATTQTDTAYDWVEMSITDANGAECAYAIFFLDTEAESANYIIGADGKVAEGRMINVADYGDGSLSITVSENGLYGNITLVSEAIDLDTIGKIVAGIEF